jgi:hypothetical protein
MRDPYAEIIGPRPLDEFTATQWEKTLPGAVETLRFDLAAAGYAIRLAAPRPLRFIIDRVTPR